MSETNVLHIFKFIQNTWANICHTDVQLKKNIPTCSQRLQMAKENRLIFLLLCKRAVYSQIHIWGICPSLNLSVLIIWSETYCPCPNFALNCQYCIFFKKSLTNFARLHTLSRVPLSHVSLLHKSCSLTLNIATSQEKMIAESTIISLVPSGQCLYELILSSSSVLNNTCALCSYMKKTVHPTM